MYKLKLTRREKKRLLRSKGLLVLLALLGLAAVGWLVWIRSVQQSRIDSFEACVRAGNPIQESYPEVCLTKDGKRFVNPKQDKAHQDNAANQDDLVPPANPALLNLDIEEWGVRVPLTEQTFDLIYTYLENGGDEYLLFTYRRLVFNELCKGDIGLKFTRSPLENQPPFTPQKPAPTVKVGQYFYYVTQAGPSCYDAKNSQHMALVVPIAGDKSLADATTALLAKLTTMPAQ